MNRQVFRVDAWIIDSNGTYSALSGYPKTFDSHNYSDDIPKAQRRAEGDLSETWGAMCKRDDRTVQTIIMTDINGAQLIRKSSGSLFEEEE